MAIATKRTKKVPTTTYTDTADGVDLRLTQAEAITVLFVLQSVGGSATTTARHYTDSVSQALQTAGVPIPKLAVRARYSSVYFAEGSKEAVGELAGLQPEVVLGQTTQACGQAAQSIPFAGVVGAIGGLNKFYNGFEALNISPPPSNLYR